MMRQLSLASLTFGALALAQYGQAAPVIVINPGGEAYPSNPAGNLDTDIPPGGFGDIAVTGWNSTVDGSTGPIVQALDRGNAKTGDIRIAFGALDGSVGAPDEAILFQGTDAVIAEGDVITLGFEGRAFFQFDADFDAQTSALGYLDGNGDLVQVDTMAHATTVSGVWNPAQHIHVVTAGSPLIGENLAIGFFTATTPNGIGAIGGFTAIDDVTLDVRPIPEPTSMAMLSGGLTGLGLLCGVRRRREVRAYGS